jgi:anti-anti-sigma factor
MLGARQAFGWAVRLGGSRWTESSPEGRFEPGVCTVAFGREVVIGPEQFAVGETAYGGEHTLMLTGELDLASTPILQRAIASLSRTMNGAGAITLDLSGLQFIDSTGLHAILATAELCQANGYEFSAQRSTSVQDREPP